MNVILSGQVVLALAKAGDVAILAFKNNFVMSHSVYLDNDGTPCPQDVEAISHKS